MKLFIVLFALILNTTVFAQTNSTATDDVNESNFIDSDDYNPFDPNIEQTLEVYDMIYELGTGQSAWINKPQLFGERTNDCYRETCTVWANVSKANQTMELWVDGELVDTWAVSSGTAGHGTPDFDRHPNGRIYDKYSSKAYPGGDYNGLGNMPYAVFIEGGFAIHGTPKANWPLLGTKASHGCIRLHPDHGKTFNRLVREYGIEDTWITVD